MKAMTKAEREAVMQHFDNTIGATAQKSRFSEFNDDEVYMLSRQAVESSAEIVLMDKYSESEQLIHTALLNELVEERKRRRL